MSRSRSEGAATSHEKTGETGARFASIGEGRQTLDVHLLGEIDAIGPAQVG
jgi:hypothetical protein